MNDVIDLQITTFKYDYYNNISVSTCFYLFMNVYRPRTSSSVDILSLAQ